MIPFSKIKKKNQNLIWKKEKKRKVQRFFSRNYVEDMKEMNEENLDLTDGSKKIVGTVYDIRYCAWGGSTKRSVVSSCAYYLRRKLKSHHHIVIYILPSFMIGLFKCQIPQVARSVPEIQGSAFFQLARMLSWLKHL